MLVALCAGGGLIGLAFGIATRYTLRILQRFGASFEQQIALTFACGYLSFYVANAPASKSGMILFESTLGNFVSCGCLVVCTCTISTTSLFAWYTVCSTFGLWESPSKAANKCAQHWLCLDSTLWAGATWKVLFRRVCRRHCCCCFWIVRSCHLKI